MVKVKSSRGFGWAIRQRRRQIDMTQDELARRIKTSTPYIGHLESGKRHPSERIVIKLAQVLGLDPREMYFLANPRTAVLVSRTTESKGAAAWESFAMDHNLRRVHNITEQEMQMLSRVGMMGEVRSSRDFLFILNSIRMALRQ